MFECLLLVSDMNVGHGHLELTAATPRNSR